MASRVSALAVISALFAYHIWKRVAALREPPVNRLQSRMKAAQAQAEGKEESKINATPLLNNSYFALRHGESVPNVKKIICSAPQAALDPVVGGLTDKGREQAAAAAAELTAILKQSGLPFEKVILVSSDFARARETASVVQQKLRIRQQDFVLEAGLRERDFGLYEGQSSECYPLVWAHDCLNSRHTHEQVESVASVFERTMDVVLQCEQRYAGAVIVLVSHGDTLQVSDRLPAPFFFVLP